MFVPRQIHMRKTACIKRLSKYSTSIVAVCLTFFNFFSQTSTSFPAVNQPPKSFTSLHLRRKSTTGPLLLTPRTTSSHRPAHHLRRRVKSDPQIPHSSVSRRRMEAKFAVALGQTLSSVAAALTPAPFCPQGHLLSLIDGQPQYYGFHTWACDMCSAHLSPNTRSVLHCEISQLL